jgi:hypothetical protein
MPFGIGYIIIKRPRKIKVRAIYGIQYNTAGHNVERWLVVIIPESDAKIFAGRFQDVFEAVGLVKKDVLVRDTHRFYLVIRQYGPGEQAIEQSGLLLRYCR